MKDIFAPLARIFPDFESRPGQALMHDAVDEALLAGEHLCVEAPCGVGKTFAYLLPAIRRALEEESPVVVATANIALQEQLMRKDLPALVRASKEKFSFALIKGIGNYLCLDRFEDYRAQPGLMDDEERHQWNRLAEWAEETRSGDRSNLPFEPSPALWSSICGVTELCTGMRCGRYEECFAMAARRRLRGVDIIVCNYHVLFSHLVVRMSAERDILLPPFKHLICDEAHEMTDVARSFFGLRLTPWSIHHLVGAARRFHLTHRVQGLRKESRTFFDDLARLMGPGESERRLVEPGFIDGRPLRDEVVNLREDLVHLLQTRGDDGTREKVEKMDRAAEHYLRTLEGFLRLDDDNMVYWAERTRDGKALLRSMLLDASGLLRAELFEQYRSAILTSATLTTDENFTFLRQGIGLDEARETTVPTSFDFTRQCRLVVPRMRHRPNDRAFPEEASEAIRALLHRLGGRTLCLFTSYRNLRTCADAAEETGVRILRQGDLPRTRLLDEFRHDRSSALFATASFWQGVDVPGEALSCLVIDRLPFLRPDSPLLSALQERDPDSFRTYSLPRAILDLRQGFGRLIRRKDDRGAVVILDTRILTARYGPMLLRSLPPAPLTHDLDEVGRFLDGNDVFPID